MEIEHNDDHLDQYRIHTDAPKVKRSKKSSETARLVWMVGGKEHQVLDTGTWALMQQEKKKIKGLYTVGTIEVRA